MNVFKRISFKRVGGFDLHVNKYSLEPEAGRFGIESKEGTTNDTYDYRLRHSFTMFSPE